MLLLSLSSAILSKGLPPWLLLSRGPCSGWRTTVKGNSCAPGSPACPLWRVFPELHLETSLFTIQNQVTGLSQGTDWEIECSRWAHVFTQKKKTRIVLEGRKEELLVSRQVSLLSNKFSWFILWFWGKDSSYYYGTSVWGPATVCASRKVNLFSFGIWRRA